MTTFHRFIPKILITLGALVAASEAQVFSFPNGANSLFIGHSFFVPIAQQFDLFATNSGEFPNHNLQSFKKGGENGSPESLWENDKDEIEAIFLAASSSGTPIELFGMTAGAPSDLEQPASESLLYYRRWIDLALSYNPNTSIYIGLPWKDFPADYTDATVYSSFMQETAAYVWPFIKDLRGMYPNSNILYFDYGSIVGKMRHLFEDDELVGISSFIKSGGATKRTSLFSDTKGHSGTMTLDMTALSYLNWFYGRSIESNIDSASDLLGWNRQNAVDIFSAASEANEEYMLLPKEPAPMIRLVKHSEGFNKPVAIVDAKDGKKFLYIVERDGTIKKVNRENGEVKRAPFLDVSTLLGPCSGYCEERGLLGLAFHPNHGENGYFYINYTSEDNGVLITFISRFSRSASKPGIADESSELILLSFEQPYSNQ